MSAGHSPGVSGRLDLSDAVRAVVRSFSTDPRPEARVALQQVLASTDSRAVVDDTELVDAVLAWITVAGTEDPHVSRWADYAAEASRRLHGDEHQQTRRARLACHAVRTGLLPKHDNSGTQTVYAISERITDTSGDAGQDSKRVTDHLIACVALHLHGVCDDVVTELGRALTTVKDRHDGSSSDLAALIVVLAAMLTACRRDQDAYRLLDEHPEILDPAGSRGRDLFAECALTLTDLLAAPHQLLCTLRRPVGEPAYDRHTWSARLHGDDPNQHVCPAPPPALCGPSLLSAPADTAATASLALSDLIERLDHESRRSRRAQAARWTPVWSTDVYLICDPCRLGLLLGAATVDPDTPDMLCTPPTLDGQPSWQHPALNRGLWRLLSDHAGHDLHVTTYRSPRWRKYTVNRPDVIGDLRPGEALTAVAHGAYVDGWPYHPGLSEYQGATPTPAYVQDNFSASLICLSCRLDLVLGDITAPADRSPSRTITIDGRLAACAGSPGTRQ